MKQNKIHMLLAGAAVLSATIIVGCNSGSSSSSKPGTVTDPVVIKDSKPITISPMASIPSTGVGHQFSVRINNIADQDYILNKIEIIDPLTGKSAASQIEVSSSFCDKIAKNSYCVVKVKPLTSKSSAFILKASLSSGGKQEVVSQLIRISDKIRAKDGIYFNNDIHELMADAKGSYSLSLPFVLEKNFESLTVTNGLLSCDSKAKGAACTYTLAGKISADKTLVATNIEGRSGQDNLSIRGDTYINTNTSYTHVLLSQPKDITTDDNGKHSTATVIAYNMGSMAAKGVDITANGGFKVTPTNCDNLGSEDICTMNVDLAQDKDKELSLSGALEFKYQAHQGGQKIATASLFYDASKLGLGVEFIGDANKFLDTLVGETKDATYTIKNTGLKTLSNLQLKLSTNDIGMKKNECNNQSLKAGEKCHIELEYHPKSSQTPAVATLGLSARYIDRSHDGKEISRSVYASTPINYSALAFANLFSLEPSQHSFIGDHTITDNSHAQTYTIKNISNLSPVLGKAAITGLDTGAEGDFTIDGKADDGSCATKTKLDNGAACTVTGVFKPTKEYTKKQLEITLPVSGLATSVESIRLGATLDAYQDAVSQPDIQYTQAVEIVDSPVKNEANIAEADGKTSLIDFILLGSENVVVTYAFTNEGKGFANKFNVATSALPPVFELLNDGTSTNCPIGTEIRTLKPNEVCAVTVRVPKLKYVTSGLLGSGFEGALQLGYSYEGFDGNKNLSHVVKETDATNVKISTKVVGNIKLEPQVIKHNDHYSIDLKVTLGTLLHNALPAAADNDKHVPIQAGIKGISTASNRCSALPNTTAECQDLISLPLSFPAGNHILDVEIGAYTNYTQTHHVEFVIPQAN